MLGHWADACFDIVHEPGRHARPEVDVVSSLVHTAMRQYAVISIRTVPHYERLVIAYPDEKTLRDCLAGPSIVALGYSSRQEAEASICRCKPTAQPLCRASIATLAADRMLAVKKFVPRHLPSKGPLGPAKTRSTIWGLLQHTIAAAVVVLYSKNALSAAVRALISF